ncbi:MAG: murein L,D-transpeptidase catalytic domain family protein [Lysobacter sp.]
MSMLSAPTLRACLRALAVLSVALSPGCSTTPGQGAVAPVPVPTTTSGAPPAGSLRAPVARELTLAQRLAAAAPAANPEVLELALQAQRCAVGHGDVAPPQRLAVIDYSRPSTEPRMWVFSLADARLLYFEHVAHGKHSGTNLTTAFSNVEGSLQSSLGLFSTAETYIGGNGYSLRMDGLEPGINDRARERLLVIHGANYVNPLQALRQGRLGRSYGCPAVRASVAKKLIDSLKGGQLLFAYYPDRQWLQGSRFLGCNKGDGVGASVSGRVEG